MYDIVFVATAWKEYKGLPKAIRKRVDEALEIIAVNPLAEILRFKKIRGRENHYRVRIGEYRLIYSPSADTVVVRVIRIGHRKDVYRHF